LHLEENRRIPEERKDFCKMNDHFLFLCCKRIKLVDFSCHNVLFF